MASSSLIARRYFDALARRDIEAAVACWGPGAQHRLVGQVDLTAPDGVRELLSSLFSAFPDLSFEILDVTTHRERCAVRWRASGTFVGPGRLQGFTANNAVMSIEGCDVFRIADDLILHSDVYTDTADLVRQLGLTPATGSSAESRRTAIINARTSLRQFWNGGRSEAIAAGVWLLRGGCPRLMNVYMIEEDGGVTVYDAGISSMTDAIRAAAVPLGGIHRIILGHADCDHRGSAAGLRAPVYCHALERSAAESPSPFRDYWNLDLLTAWTRPIYPPLLRSWDGGGLEIAGTVEDGEDVAGFKVVHLPGHAPGLIGLFREEDRLALVSDCFYTVNPETGMKNEARVPHPALNKDTDQARESIRKLAALKPAIAWAGHARPVFGEDIELQLQRAASAAV